MNVAEMTLEQLLDLQLQVKQGLEKQKDSAIFEMVATMNAMGITVAELAKHFQPELVAVTKTGRGSFKRVPKYRNPSNPDETWSGVGKMPTWFKVQVEKGMVKEDMLIPS